MGTQLAYGGSGSAPWDDAAADAVAVDAAPAPASGDPGTGPAPDTNIDSLINHVIDAIQAHETRPIPGTSATYTPASVRPSAYRPAGAASEAAHRSSSARRVRGAVQSSRLPEARRPSPRETPSSEATRPRWANSDSTWNASET